MTGANISLRVFLVLQLLLLPLISLPDAMAAKLDCSSAGSGSSDLPRTAALATNPAGTGAHALGAGLASVASKVSGISLKVQPYNGPNAWMPLLESGELELGVLNILDSQMAATGTGNYKKAYPMVRVIAGGVFPFTASAMVRDKSDIKQISDLKGKRVAWDYGGHAISQTFLNAVLETGGIKPGDVQQVRVSNVNDGIRAVPEGKVDASWASLGTGTNEEANSLEPIRMLNIPNTDAVEQDSRPLRRLGGQGDAVRRRARRDLCARLCVAHCRIEQAQRPRRRRTDQSLVGQYCRTPNPPSAVQAMDQGEPGDH